MAITSVNCPICKKKVQWIEANQYRPFCSERCKLIDLGEWASGNRFIPEDADYDDTTAADLDREGER